MDLGIEIFVFKLVYTENFMMFENFMLFGTNFLFQFEPVIRNLDDNELKYFQLFWSGGVDNTRWKKVRFDAYFPVWKLALKPVFHLGEFVCANRERSNLIGW